MFDFIHLSIPPAPALFAQLLVGLINGAFYAMLSLGLAVIFGLLNIINFAHGAQYMMGAFAAYFLLQYAGLGYGWALLIAPVIIGLLGMALERVTLKRLYHLDHLYGLLLTFGVALAALAGVLAAPIYQVNPLMGGDLIIVVFAVVVIGGMGSILGSIITGFALGLVEGLTKVFYPEASNTVIFVIMAIVLLVRPTGLFGRAS